jgi:hypothetical protein
VDQLELSLVEGALPRAPGQAEVAHGVKGDESVVPGDECFETMQFHAPPGRADGAETERAATTRIRAANGSPGAPEAAQIGNRAEGRPERAVGGRVPGE